MKSSTDRECTCEHKFLDAEDYRDHLPCLGHRIAIEERKRIARWLMTMQITPHKEPADYASMIERGDHLKSIAETINKHMEKK